MDTWDFEKKPITETQAMSLHPCKWPIQLDPTKGRLFSIRSTVFTPVSGEGLTLSYDIPPKFCFWEALKNTAAMKHPVRLLLSESENRMVYDLGDFVLKPFDEPEPSKLTFVHVSAGAAIDDTDPVNTWTSCETLYKSVIFKSRLEAETAVFMDLAEIKYWYQPDMLLLPNIRGNESWRYRPDFYLPDFQMYLEIKPAYPLIEEKLRCQALACRGFKVALMYGRPKQGDWHEKKNRVYFGADAQRGFLYLPPIGEPCQGELNWVEQPNGSIGLDLIRFADDPRNRTPKLQMIWDQVRNFRFTQ